MRLGNKYTRWLIMGVMLIIPAIFIGLTAHSANAQVDTCPDISPLACVAVKISPPQVFEFDGTGSGLLDKNGVGMGFTMVDPPSKPGNPVPDSSAPGYWPEKLELVNNTLVISTTNGLMTGVSNSQDNALGIGLDMGGSIALETTLFDIFPAPGGYVQAGLWFGKSAIGPSGLGGTGSVEDNYIKLVLISSGADIWRVQASMEEDGLPIDRPRSSVDGTQPVTLRLELNPSLGSVIARYCNTVGCDASQAEVFQTFNNIPSDWFSADAAGIDFNVGTRSMGGIFASNRQALESVEFIFDRLVYETSYSTSDLASKDGIDFESWTFSPVFKPTAVAWGPDNRLYVADVSGMIHAFTLNHEIQAVLAEQLVSTVAGRLMLGMTIDPESTADNVILWVSHSDLSQDNGAANSGIVTRLSGADFSERLDVITGLPRAIANHATNNIHFGPDNRLYIAQGGNTGAGAANDGPSEFGARPEQPLSAAILVADVKAPVFDGSCASEIDPDGTTMDATGISARDIPCDVQVYASGLRNAYDFTFIKNGDLYATENGLGVVGTFPNLFPDDLSWNPVIGCEGLIEGSTAIQDHFPGERPDLLQRIVQGGYYGHPNPSRAECKFFGGNPTSGDDYEVPSSSAELVNFFMDTDKYSVGVIPEPTWLLPTFAFGENKSANGIIEYDSGSAAFCGRMDGDLLVTYFSQDDQVRRVQLAENGTVQSDTTLLRTSAAAGGGTLSNPLPIAQDPNGRIYVGEFGFSQITVFDPVNVGLWTTEGVADLPVALLDAGGAALDGRLYMVAGKTAGGHQKATYSYNPAANTWVTLANLPDSYPGVENPAVVAHNGLLYAFGGSTSPFTGAVTNAAVFDPTMNQWTSLASMPTGRGGAATQALGDSIYVIGGLDTNGDSVNTVEAYDLTAGTWSTVPSMLTARDNAGSAVIDEKIYIFGGRTRLSGSNVEGTLNTLEFFNPNDSSWNTGAPMPTGRRSMSVVVYDGEAILLGGEKNAEGGTFVAAEGYDASSDRWRLLTDMPMGRHGAVAGVLNNGIVIAGGGPEGGTSYTADADIFHFECDINLAGQQSLFMPMIMR